MELHGVQVGPTGDIIPRVSVAPRVTPTGARINPDKRRFYIMIGARWLKALFGKSDNVPVVDIVPDWLREAKR